MWSRSSKDRDRAGSAAVTVKGLSGCICSHFQTSWDQSNMKPEDVFSSLCHSLFFLFISRVLVPVLADRNRRVQTLLLPHPFNEDNKKREKNDAFY